MGDKVIPVKVALRIRPLINKEVCDGCRECIEVVPNERQVIIGCGSEKAFTYDFVFGPMAHQSELYEDAVQPLIETFFNGYNATVVAYGQTGSGKTYTMGTCAALNNDEIDEEISQGVIPSIIKDLFSEVENRKEKCDFLVKCSFLEIHNEEIRDLLCQNLPDEKGLAVRESTTGEIKIAGLQEVSVKSFDDLVSCLEKGSSARATGATAMNTRSSRSHAIFTIMMEQRAKTGARDMKKAKFHLVDLAGSERAKRTQASGERFKEGININKGLLSLGNVISALGDEQRKSHAHVPYRDSKLTRLLQDSLGGNSTTVMIACVSPADSNMEETHNTLKYADRARKIKNKPVVNRDPAAAELSKLRQQVQMLQLQLLEGQYIHQEESKPEIVAGVEEVLERNKQLESENEKLTSELHEAIDQTTVLHEKIMLIEISKDKIQQKAGKLKDKILSHGLELSFDLSEDKENVDSADMVKQIQMKVEEMDRDERLPSASVELPCSQSVDHESSDGEALKAEIADSSYATHHALRKAELAKQLQELNKALTMKEEVANKILENDTRIITMKRKYEMTVKDLEQVIEKLEQEKSQLNTALSASKPNPDSHKKGRERMRELETQLGELRKKQVEYQRLQRTKEQGDVKITKLDAEIKGMKQMKVKLMRQMKEESEKFRQWKLTKEKEINQLKQQGRKRQFEYKKLESVHVKQQAVLRRKTEEAAAANKRLKAALCKQKEATEKRNQSMYNQNKQSETVLERMKSWLTHEVEVMVSSGEARNALKVIIEDRKTLSQEISALKSQMQAKIDEPSSKKMSLNGGETSLPVDSDISMLKKQIQTLEIDLEVRSSQIGEIQQKIIDAEQGERTKFRWNNVHTMAEAKSGLKTLFNWVVDSKLAQAELNKTKESSSRMSVQSGVELEKMRRNYEEKMSSITEGHERYRTIIQKQHKEKIGELRAHLEEQNTKLREMEEKYSSYKQRMEEVTKVLQSEKNAKKTAKKKPKTVTLHESFLEEEDEYASVTDCDSDYIPTPIRRKEERNVRRSVLATKPKRTSKASTCSCKGDCNSKRCRCKAGAVSCSVACRCSQTSCLNRAQSATVVSHSVNVGYKSTDRQATPTSGVSRVLSPIHSVTKNIPAGVHANNRTPLAIPVKNQSPRFVHPAKTLKSKSRRLSVKHLSNNAAKKLLNTSKSASNILTPSRHFVGPMASRRPSSSDSKSVSKAKPL